MFRSAVLHSREVRIDRRQYAEPRSLADAIFKELEGFLQANDFGNPPAVIALSRDFYVWRNFRVPPVAAGNLDSLIAYEIERHLPVDAANLYVRTIATATEEPGWRVQLFAAKKEVVGPLVEALELIGCRVAAIVPDLLGALAEIRFVGGKSSPAGEIVAVHDHDSVETYLFRDDALVDGGVSRIEPDQPNPAEEAASGGAHQASRAQRVARGIAAALADMHAPGGASATRKEDRRWYFPSSGGSDLVLDLLRREGGADWSLIPTSSGPAAGEGRRYPISLGLSREPDRLVSSPLNLLTAPPAGTSALRLVTAASVAFLVVALAALGAATEYRSRRQLRMLDARIDVLRARADEVLRLSDAVRGDEVKLRDLGSVVSGSPTMVDLLAELSLLLPVNAHLTQLVLKKDSLEISGFADAAAGLIQTLEESKMFRNVAFDAPITTQGAQKERFKIRMALER